MDNRELDALAAEHIEGWQWWISTPKPEITPTPKHVLETIGMRFLRPPGYVNWVRLQVPAVGDEPIAPFVSWRHASDFPHYSTDPVACQQLKERMRADGWNYNFRWRADQRSVLNGWYSGEFWRGTDESHGAREISELRAVVLAALRAKGIEVPNA